MYSLSCICPCVFLCGVWGEGGVGGERELREREVERQNVSVGFICECVHVRVDVCRTICVLRYPNCHVFRSANEV